MLATLLAMTAPGPLFDAPRPGDRIAGRFALIAEAGRGGMATVFRARDRRWHRDVAVKLLRGQDLDGRARFAREASLLSEVCHPNVVRYLEHGATPDGVHYLVMEWLDGTTLAHRLARSGVSLVDSVATAIQVCHGLAAIHARGVIHRDIKPSNIMLTGDVGAVKLVDLGVARRRDDIGALTRTGVVVGTAGYLAPEQIRGGRAEVDERADLFALGCVLYACLAGAPAFAGDSRLAVYAKVLLHDPVPLAAIDASLPPALTTLVGGLLSRDRAARPASAVEVAGALAALLDELRDDASAPRPVLGPRPPISTVTAAPMKPECGLLAIDLPAELLAAPPLTARIVPEPFDGDRVVAATGSIRDAAELARALAVQAPGATIVVAADTAGGTSWIDRAATVLGELVLAHRLAGGGDGGPGAWIDPAVRGDLPVIAVGRHLRLTAHAEPR